MNSKAEQLLKDDPTAWAAWEYSNNFTYWSDRAQNGSGLIQTIAGFVLENGEVAK